MDTSQDIGGNSFISDRFRARRSFAHPPRCRAPSQRHKTKSPFRRTGLREFSEASRNLARGSGLLVFLGRCGRGFRREIHPFEDGLLGGITLALIQANDAGVTTSTLLEGRRDLIEQDVHDVFLLAPRGANGGTLGRRRAFEVSAGLLAQARSGETAVMQGAAL